MQLINVDGPVTPPMGGAQDLPVRQGAGNSHKSIDAYRNIKMARKEFTVAGIADKTVLPILLSNALTIAVSTAPASYDLPAIYTAPTMTHGASFSDNTGTLTFAWVSPEANKSKIYPGCVITKLTISGGVDDGGRIHFEATVMTGYAMTDNQAAPSSMSAYPATFYFMSDFTTTAQIDGNDVILNGFDLTITNPAEPKGRQGTNADPQDIARGIPAAMVEGNFNILYDGNTSHLRTTEGAGTDVVFEFSNHVTWGSATGFGIMGSYGKLKEIPDDAAESGMAQNVPVQFLASTSGDQIQIIA